MTANESNVTRESCEHVAAHIKVDRVRCATSGLSISERGMLAGVAGKQMLI